MKTAKQILLAASVMVLVLASKTAFGQGTTQPGDPTDPSQVDPSDILSAPIISQWPDNTFVPVTFDPSQISDGGGISQSASFNLSPTPAPEPSSFALLTAGLLIGGTFLYRTHKKVAPRVSA